MIYRMDYKVPGGKLIRVAVELEADRVKEARVSGDFFAHPEAAFEKAELSLAGIPAAELEAAALTAFSEPGLRIFGAAPEDIARALTLALGGAA